MKKSQLVQLIREELQKENAHKNIEDNLMRVLNREKPELKMSKEGQYSREALIDYLSQLEPTIDVTIPSIRRAGYDAHVSSRYTAQQAIDALNSTDLPGTFRLIYDKPTVKKFELVEPDDVRRRREDLIGNF